MKANCWARWQAKRQKHTCKYGLCYRFEPHYHKERLDEPLHTRKPCRIGLNFMGETFDRMIRDINPEAWKDMLDMMNRASWHTFVILTKQPQNIPKSMVFPKNVWLGVTVNRKSDLWRIDSLREADAQTMFVSFEPLYEDLNDVNLEGIDWIIIGGQTRPTLLPSYPWVLGLIQKAKSCNLPIFIKNNLKEVMARWPPLQEFPQ